MLIVGVRILSIVLFVVLSYFWAIHMLVDGVYHLIGIFSPDLERELQGRKKKLQDRLEKRPEKTKR